MKLREAFAQLDNLPWTHVIYMPDDNPSLDTEVVVLDPDEAEPDEDIPTEARHAGFLLGLSVADTKDIRANARAQGKAPDPEDLLLAFVYYLKNDAFIRF